MRRLHLKETNGDTRRIKTEWVGAAIRAGGATMKPVMRLDGVVGAASQAPGAREFGWLRLRPVRATVTDAAGRETTVMLHDINEAIQRNMTLAGALLAAAALIAMWVRRLKR